MQLHNRDLLFVKEIAYNICIKNILCVQNNQLILLNYNFVMKYKQQNYKFYSLKFFLSI